MIKALLTKLFPKFKFNTKKEAYEKGFQDAITQERERVNNNYHITKFHELKQFMGKRIIVISDKWTDPWIGAAVGIENWPSSDGFPMLFGRNSHTGLTTFSGGKIIPFSFPILKALTQINPFERWEMLTGQKILQTPPFDVKLKSYEELIEGLS